LPGFVIRFCVPDGFPSEANDLILIVLYED
jgi:hypothetical protein